MNMNKNIPIEEWSVSAHLKINRPFNWWTWTATTITEVKCQQHDEWPIHWCLPTKEANSQCEAQYKKNTKVMHWLVSHLCKEKGCSLRTTGFMSGRSGKETCSIHKKITVKYLYQTNPIMGSGFRQLYLTNPLQKLDVYSVQSKI
jgi:hypothetical protein